MVIKFASAVAAAIRVVPIVLALGMATGAYAAEPPPVDASIEDLAISLAKTPAQHATIAAFYAAKAEEARKAADRHRSMARSYGGKREMYAEHCRNLARLYREMATEYAALAQGHRGTAR